MVPARGNLRWPELSLYLQQMVPVHLTGKGSQTISSEKDIQEQLLSFSMGHPTVLVLLPALLEGLESSPMVASHSSHLSLSISRARRP